MEPLFYRRKQKLDRFKNRRNIAELTAKEIPDCAIHECSNCSHANLYEEWVKNLYVCPKCNHHDRISARERLRQICDSKSFKETNKNLQLANKSNFPGYQEKLDQLKKKYGIEEAVITGIAKIEGHKTVIAVMDGNFMMGSMGAVVGEKITRAIELATKKRLPIILFSISGGARMQEGIISLVQMAKTTAAITKHKEAGLLVISVLCSPTTGGVLASFAMLGDINIAEPNALIGFAGKRVIESTINETLPDNFQRAEFVLEKGFLDCIVPRNEMRNMLSRLLALHKE